MSKPRVKGVVRNGQVVLDEPVDLPDGTVVEITADTHADADKRAMLAVLNRLDLIDDPDWRAKVEADRIAYTEKLTSELAGMWAHRQQGAA
jgi:hypothetical protein